MGEGLTAGDLVLGAVHEGAVGVEAVEGADVAARLTDGGDSVVGGGFIEIEKSDAGTIGRKGFGNGAADTFAGAGDDGGFVSERFGHVRELAIRRRGIQWEIPFSLGAIR